MVWKYKRFQKLQGSRNTLYINFATAASTILPLMCDVRKVFGKRLKNKMEVKIQKWLNRVKQGSKCIPLSASCGKTQQEQQPYRPPDPRSRHESVAKLDAIDSRLEHEPN